MATQTTLADVLNFKPARKKMPVAMPPAVSMSAPPAVAKPAVKPGHSLQDVLNFRSSSPASNQTSLAQRAFEALPGAKGVEEFAGKQADYWGKQIKGQEDYWGGQAKTLRTLYGDVAGRNGHKGSLQRAYRDAMADPEVQKSFEKENAPLFNLDLTGLGAKVSDAGTPEEYREFQRERARRDAKLEQHEMRAVSLYRGLMEGLGDTISGLTSPMNLALMLGTEGAGLEAKMAVKEAQAAAEAEAGLAAARRGVSQHVSEEIAGKAGAHAAKTAATDFAAQQSLREFTTEKAMSTLMSAGFTYQMLSGVKPAFDQATAQFRAGDYTGGTRSTVDALVSLGFGAMSGAHALHGSAELRGAWKNEREVKAALNAGAQETYKKPWKNLTQEEKAKVAFDAVTKYGPEQAKQYHRQIQALPPISGNAIRENDRLFDRAMADREAMDAGNAAIFGAYAQPAPQPTPEDLAYEAAESQWNAWQEKRRPAESKTASREPLEVRDRLTLNEPPPARKAKPEGYDERKNAIETYEPRVEEREFGQGVVEKRRAEMDALPHPDKTRLPNVVLFNTPVASAAEREEMRLPTADGARRTLELEETLQRQREEEEAEHVERRAEPELRQQIMREITEGRVQENPDNTGYREITDQLDSMASSLFPDLQVASKPEAGYQRLRQMQLRGDRLTDGQAMFMRQYHNRATLERQLAGQIPSLKAAVDATIEEGSTEAARALVENAQRLRELNEAAEALRAERPDSPDAAAMVADNLARARQFAEQRRTRMNQAQASMNGEATPLKPGAPVSRGRGRATSILLSDGRELEAHYAAVRLSDIRDRVPGVSSVRAEDYNPEYYLSTDPMAEAGPATILPDGRLVNGGRRLAMLDEARKGPDGGRVLREMDNNLYRFGLESDGVDRQDPAIPVRVLDTDVLTEQDLARLRAELDRGPVAVPEPLPPTVEVNLHAAEMEEVAEALKNSGGNLHELLGKQFGGDLLRKMVEKGVLDQAAADAMVDDKGMLTPAGRNAVQRILLKRALGGNVDDIPEAVLDRISPEIGNLTRIGDGPLDWHIGDYLREAMRDLGTIDEMRPALERVGTSSDPVTDKYYRPFNYRRGDRIFQTPPAEPHPVTEALARMLEKERGGALKDYAIAMEDRFRTGRLPASEFNRTVASKMGMEVAAEDWGTVRAATPAEKAERAETRAPVVPTPEEKIQQANPTAVPEEIRRQQAVDAVTQQALEGNVSPESLKALFETDPRFKEWAEPLLHIFHQVIPKATGLSLADFLKRAIADVKLVPEIVMDKRTGQQAAGLAQFMNDSQAILSFSDKANVSTVVHEFFHVMRRYLKADDLAVLEAYADKQIKAAGQFGGPGEWRGNDKDEVLARTWERYLATGEAPDNHLKNIFNKLKTALKGIYYTLIGKPDQTEAELDPKSPLNKLKSGAKIKITPEVKAVFDAWFKADEAKKPLEEPPRAPGAAPETLKAVTPAAGERTPQAGAAALAAAEEKRNAAQVALDDVARSVDDQGLLEKPEGQMDLSERIILDRYKKAAKAAADADEAVAKLRGGKAAKPLAPPPGPALTNQKLTPEQNKAIQKQIDGKKLTRAESDALGWVIENAWGDLPLEFWKDPEVREGIAYFRENPGMEDAFDGKAGVEAALKAMRKYHADRGDSKFPNTAGLTSETAIDDLVGKLTPEEKQAWAEKEGIAPEALAPRLKEMRRSVAALVAGLSSDADDANLPLAMVEARKMIEEHAGPIAEEPKQLTAPPEKVIEGRMAPPPGASADGAKVAPPARFKPNDRITWATPDGQLHNGRVMDDHLAIDSGGAGRTLRVDGDDTGHGFIEDDEHVWPEGQKRPKAAAPKSAAKIARGAQKLTQDWGGPITGYSDDPNRETGSVLKDKFLKETRKYLDGVAAELAEAGFTPYADRKGKPGRPVSVSEGGPAVSGDVNLSMLGPDGKGIYAKISEAGVAPTTKSRISIMYRTTDAKDPYGPRSTNKWAPVDLSASELADLFKKTSGVEKSGLEKPRELTAPPGAREAENASGLAKDMLKITGDARELQARFLAEQGMKWDDARKLEAPERLELQNKYEEWLKKEQAPKPLEPPPAPYGEPLLLTPFGGYSDSQMWETERSQYRPTDEMRNVNAFEHVLKLRGFPDNLGQLETTVSGFWEVLQDVGTWEEAVARVGDRIKEMDIASTDDGVMLGRIARHLLKGKDLTEALFNLAEQIDPDNPAAGMKSLLAMDAPPEETGTSEVQGGESGATGQPEDQSARAAGDAEGLPGLSEPPRQGGDAPAPVQAEGDQAAAGGEDARPDAGRTDPERVEHAGGLPGERSGDGSGAGGGAAADSASGRAGGRTGSPRGGSRKGSIDPAVRPVILDEDGKPIGAPADAKVVGADGQAVESPAPQKPKQAKLITADLRNRNNYRISDEYAASIGSGGEITKIKGNLDALQTLKEIQESGRETATPEEQATLARYVDFGGLVGMLQNRYKPEYREHYARYENLLSAAERQEINETLPNTHYTSMQMVDWMWKAMQKMGFKGGRILEPGMGVGNFFGRMPKAISDRAELYGVERNPLTGGMAKLLYPDARIMVRPFQQVMIPDNSLDAIIGNPPFQDVAITDDPIYRKLKLSLHNYFIVKTLDKLRPGGIATVITSRYTMDNTTGLGVRAREEMARRADLIAAFRLPDTAFKGNANTSVVADVLIFRKRAPGDVPEGFPDWTKVEKITVKGDEPIRKTSYYSGQSHEYIENAEEAKDKSFYINKYFTDNPAQVLGAHSKEGKQYQANSYTVKPPENFTAALEKAMEKVPAKAFGKVKESEVNQPPSTLDPGELNFAPEDVKPGSYYRDKDGTILMKQSGVGVPLPIELNPAAARQHIGHAIDLRDQLNQIIHTQLSTSDDGLMRDQQKMLDRLYEQYRGKYGSLHGPELRKVFGDDPEYPKLLALENLDPETKTVSKADIFTRRVLAPYEPLRDLPEDPKAAMLKVMAEKGHLDTGLMAELLKKPEEEVIGNLAKEGLIYEDPKSGGYATADEYLSGHVREKLRQARQAAEVDPKYKANVEALEKVQPAAVTIHEMQPSLGQTWIPNEIYTGFIQYLANGLHADYINISRDHHTGKWLVQIDTKNVTHDLKNKWGTSRVPGHKLVQYAMNQQLPTVWDNHSDGTRTLNREATLGARDKLSAIKEEFRTVLRRAKPDVTENLEQIYNDTFGGYRLREFSGEHLTFPGMSEEWRGKIRGYQKASVWRILQDGRGGIFHAPGLGKTLTMAAAGMEARRLKLSRKNMYAVPNHMIPQWRDDFKRFYPNANVLAVTDQDFTAENRNKLMSRIATGDWDAILVPHSQFDTLPMSPEWERQTINKRLDEYRSVLQELDDKDDERTIKQIEKAIDKLESRLNDLNAKKKDNTINFDQLGIDMLFVDEAHLYKSMAVPTKMSGIGGVSNSASQRAFALEMKGDYLRQMHGGRGLVFGTGTPITNTIGELYIMNKYLAPELLEEAGIRSFDDWVANFAQTRTEYEYGADGVTFKPKTTLSEFVNVPELSTMFRRFAEYLSKESARALSNLKEPEVKRHDLTVKITPVQEPLMDMIARRGQALIDSPPKTAEEKKADNWLKLSSDARKISLDPRLYDPKLKDHPDSKVNKSVESIKKVLDATKAKQGTVVVFSDFYQHLTASGRPDFNLYEDMRHKLVKKGIPKDQIAIIHEAKNREAKNLVFKKVNAGKVRVIFGSTDTMGIGTNIQDRLKAEFHLDQPWRPDQVEQREGRIVRSGNMWDEVEIHRLIAEPETGKRQVWVVDGFELVDGKSKELGHYEEQDRPRAYDLQMYQQLARKASFQEQFLTGNYSGRTMEDTGGDVKLNSQMFALGKAMATGNPDALRKLKLETDLRTFELLQRNHQTEVWRNASTLNYRTLNLASTRSHLAKVREKIATFNANAKKHGDGKWDFTLEIAGKLIDDEAVGDLLKTNDALDNLVGKSIKIAGLKTDIDVEEERYRPDEKHWDYVEKRPNFIYTDPAGEKRAVNRANNGEQTLKTLVGSFLRRAGELPKDESSDVKRIPELEKEIQDLTEELQKPSPYAERLATMQKEIAEIDQRLGIKHAPEADEVAVEDEEEEGGKPAKGEDDDKLYQEAAPEPLSVLTPEEQESEIVAADGNLQDHMAGARVKEFPSVPEANSWLVNAAQGDRYQHTFHGSQVREMPDGRGLVLYAPKNPDVLFQEAMPEQARKDLMRERQLALNKLQSMEYRALLSKEGIQKLQNFVNDADRRLGLSTPGLISFTPPPENVDARPAPGKVESMFPEEAKRGTGTDRPSTDKRPAAPDDSGRVRDAGRVPGMAEQPDRAGGTGQAGGAGLSGGGARGDSRDGGDERGRGRPGGRGGSGRGGVTPPEPETPAPFIRMRAPIRPRGAELVASAPWKLLMKRRNMPEDTPPYTVTLDADIREVLQKYKGQQEQAEVMLSGLQQHDGVILASPTGGGKTFLGMAVLTQQMTPDSHSLVITKNRAIINQPRGWKNVAKEFFHLDLLNVPGKKAMKAGKVEPGAYVMTYAQLLRRPDLMRMPWDFVVFDEAAEARRWYDGPADKPSQGKAVKALSDVAKKAMYVSAAPYHNALEMGYMTKLNLWHPGQFDDWAQQLGARKRMRRGKEEWSNFGSDPKKLIALRDQLIRRGQFTTQEISMDGHTTDIALVETSAHQRKVMRDIRDGFSIAEEFYKSQGKKAKATRARALGALYTKNYLERLKLPQMIELAKAARKQGWDVAMFSENRKEIAELWNYLKAADEATGGEIRRRLPELPDVFAELEKGLGKDEVANYSGTATGARAKMAEVFRAGVKHFMYASYSAGGVGVSFHDDSDGGVRPKLVIHLGLPWSGMMFNQANGRFWRYGTHSNVHSIFLVGDAQPEVDLILNKVMPRLNSIHASVRGLDNQDPLVKGMRSLTRSETYRYDLGYKAKYDMADYGATAKQIPIRDWTYAKAHLPNAEEAKGKGMKYPEDDGEMKFQNKLFQETVPGTPPERFLSPDEAQALLDSEEMFDDFAKGEVVLAEGGYEDVEPGLRMELAERAKAVVADKLENRGTADAKAVMRQVGRNELSNIMAAKWAGEADAVREPAKGEPGWEMKGPPPLPEDQKVKARRQRIYSAILSGMEHIKALTKRAGVPEIGRQIDIAQRNYRAWRNQYAGELTFKLQNILKENRITKDEIRQVWMAKEGKAAPANPRIARAVEKMTGLMNEIRQMAAERGINLNDWDESGKPVSISYGDIKDNPNYMPHIFDYQEKIKLVDPQSGEEQIFTLKELLGGKELPQIRRERIINAIEAKFGAQGWTRQRIEQWIDDKKRRAPLAGNIERARTADLPFYRMDQGALIKYFTGTGEVFARTEQWGQQLEKLDAMLAQIPDKTAAKSIRNIMMDSLAPEPWSEWASNFYSIVTTAQVITKMAFSPLKVPFHLVHTGLVMEQFRPLLKAILQVPGGWKAMKQFGQLSGSIQDGVTSQMNMDMASKLNLSHRFLTYTGFNWLFETDRVIGAQTARNWMADHLLPQLIKKSKSSARIREHLTDTLLLTDKQIDEAVKRGRWTEDDFKHAGAAFTNRVMFTGDPTELPYLWRARHPQNPMVDNALIVIRVSTALKSFQFKSAMLLKRALIDEAKKGNFRAWIPFLVAYPLAGAALRLTSGAVHAALGSPQSLNNFEQELQDLFDDPTIGKAAHLWLDNVAHATAQSMASHVLDVLFFPPKEKRKSQYVRGKLSEDVIKEFLGPYGDLLELGKTLFKIGASGHDDLTSEEQDSIEKFTGHAGKDVLDLSGEVVPLVRPYVPSLEQALGFTKKSYQMAPPP